MRRLLQLRPFVVLVGVACLLPFEAGASRHAQTGAAPAQPPGGVQPAPPKPLPANVVKGEFAESAVYPGTWREYWVYVPRELDRSKPAPVMVFQDGLQYNAPAVFDDLIADRLNIWSRSPDLSAWQRIVERFKKPAKGAVKIGVVGKYVHLKDSYKSLHEALVHGGLANEVRDDLFGDSAGVAAHSRGVQHHGAEVAAHSGRRVSRGATAGRG